MSKETDKLVTFIKGDIETIMSETGEIPPIVKIFIDNQWEIVTTDSDRFKEWKEKHGWSR
ncbi:MAG: hypothetical protein C4555_03165 [Dehalococcoidia bacterium]|nr:MAG: hypothetical protein C4555_03165 [Dehalococcoidia bacterium]